MEGNIQSSAGEALGKFSRSGKGLKIIKAFTSNLFPVWSIVCLNVFFFFSLLLYVDVKHLYIYFTCFGFYPALSPFFSCFFFIIVRVMT